MKPVRIDLGSLFLGAASAGGFYASLEALGVLMGGSLWIEQPLRLFVMACVMGALLWGGLGAVVGRLMGQGVAPGVFGAAVFIGMTEAALLILTDPPPYQEAQWWVNNPWIGLLAGAGAVGAVRLARWKRWTGWVWALPILLGIPYARTASPDHVQATNSTSARPNVLLVTLDTTRGDRVGAVGYPRDTTPFFDAMAQGGIRFDSAYAQVPVTGPSHLTLFTGQGPWAHGALLNGMAVPEELPLLAERLSESGYATGAFVSAFVLDGGLGFSRGFQVYDDDFSRMHGASGFLPVRVFAAMTRRLVDSHVVERAGDQTVDLALSWLNTQEADRPWFLWVHLFDPHGPYEPPPPFEDRYYSGNPKDPANTSMDVVEDVAPYLQDHLEGITDIDWVMGRYDGEVAFADAQLGRLLTTLEERGEEDDTLVVVAGDHGESLGEHGVWFNHGGDLYAAASRVPLAMRWPSGLPSNRVVEAPVELTDVAPTLYGLLGLSGGTDSEGFSGLWEGRAGRAWVRSIGLDRAANRKARETNPGALPKWRVVALRNNSELYVYREDGENEMWSVSPGKDGGQLETRSVDTDPVVEAALEEMALELLKQGVQGSPRERAPLSDEARLRLEALGYVE
ncbi:MAG: sulfatase [Myxococcota bacterium]|nr:sulfatase [Myxococcota bacterium]